MIQYQVLCPHCKRIRLWQPQKLPLSRNTRLLCFYCNKRFGAKANRVGIRG